jgi:hypothetical protein
MYWKKHILPKSWIETKVSKDSYFINIPQEEIDNWEINRWEKDQVLNLLNKDGFHLKPHGRSGTIYYIEKKQFCQIYFENSGVKEFDILIFFEKLTKWEMSKKEVINEKEKNEIRERLISWLKEKGIRSDL